jgi:hypothetical protein
MGDSVIWALFSSWFEPDLLNILPRNLSLLTILTVVPIICPKSQV